MTLSLLGGENEAAILAVAGRVGIVWWSRSSGVCATPAEPSREELGTVMGDVGFLSGWYPPQVAPAPPPSV